MATNSLRGLLDVNVLVALLDPLHSHHRVAMDWLKRANRHGWASCPLTQNGCLRILSTPSYPNAYPVALVARHLREATSHSLHQFWPDDVDLVASNVVEWKHILGSKQVTDVYLLALATAHGDCFVTFDQHVPIGAVKSAQPKNLQVLS